MIARRYMHVYGATSEDFGAVAVADRKHAATNPKAYFYGKPITIEDHQTSRWIAEPLRLLDCCQETDGAVAIVVTSPERARDLPAPAGGHRGRGAGRQPRPVRDDQLLPRRPRRPARDGRGRPARLWRSPGCARPTSRPRSSTTTSRRSRLIQLEELGFCGRGEAKDFIADGAIELGGRLPINTHGGQLGEAYIHGMNGIAEGVRQVRGTSVNHCRNNPSLERPGAASWSRSTPREKHSPTRRAPLCSTANRGSDPSRFPRRVGQRPCLVTVWCLFLFEVSFAGFQRLVCCIVAPCRSVAPLRSIRLPMTTSGRSRNSCIARCALG